jgi:uncharacterized membrane protein YphA (DoxX/SURF4 family)
MWMAVSQAASAYVALFLRLALGVTFLSAVSDRFGIWGPTGSPNVAWGDLGRFSAYAATLNPWAPASVVPAIVWFVTVAETCLGVALIVGLFTQQAALASGVLLFLFALGMTTGTGVKSALNAPSSQPPRRPSRSLHSATPGGALMRCAKSPTPARRPSQPRSPS